MVREEMEMKLLEKLEKGQLDGIVGYDFVKGNGMTHRTLIRNGVPYYVNFPSNIGPIDSVTVVEKRLETKEGKLWFLRNAGWKMTDQDANLYSRTYKRPGGA
jgi:hypothetical protein